MNRLLFLFLSVWFPCSAMCQLDLSKVTEADIIATEKHRDELRAAAKKELADANAKADAMEHAAQVAQAEAALAKGETAALQKSINDLREWGIGEQREKFAAQAQVAKEKARADTEARKVNKASWIIAAVLTIAIFQLLHGLLAPIKAVIEKIPMTAAYGEFAAVIPYVGALGAGLLTRMILPHLL